MVRNGTTYSRRTGKDATARAGEVEPRPVGAIPTQLFGTGLYRADTFELERRDDLVDERDFLGGRVDERDVQTGTDDLQGEPGEPCAGSHVYQPDQAVRSKAIIAGDAVELRDQGNRI